MNFKEIKSRNNTYIKEISKLADKKYRELNKKFCFEGRKLLEEALQSSVPIESVLFTSHAQSDVKTSRLLEKASKYAEMILVSDEIYNKISYEKSPEGIFTVANTLDKKHNLYIIYNDSDFDTRQMILDGIRDPGNLGTVFRTASAFGCENIILSSDCADVYNPKTVRASMGAVFRIKTYRVSDLKSSIKHLRDNGVSVYSAALSDNAIPLTDVENTKKAVFVIGNEGSGIRKEIMDSTDGCVIIPMENGTESLNAASAATIILWEQYRQSR